VCFLQTLTFFTCQRPPSFSPLGCPLEPCLVFPSAGLAARVWGGE